MLRGVTRVTCPHCGHKFLAMDIEDNATVSSLPGHCPKCGQIVKIDWSGLLYFLRLGLEKLAKLTTMMDGWRCSAPALFWRALSLCYAMDAGLHYKEDAWVGLPGVAQAILSGAHKISSLETIGSWVYLYDDSGHRYKTLFFSSIAWQKAIVPSSSSRITEAGSICTTVKVNATRPSVPHLSAK